MNNLYKALGGSLPSQAIQPSAPVSPGSPGLDTGSFFNALQPPQDEHLQPGQMVAAGPSPSPSPSPVPDKVSDFLKGFKGVR